MLYLIAMMVMPAHAGKLAEGFRGLPYGDASVLDTAPMENCRPDTELAVRWFCPTQIGEAEVTVAYMVKEGLYFGNVIATPKSYKDAHALHTILIEAYGKGAKTHEWDHGALADRTWRDGTVYAGWSYNQYTHIGQVILFDLDKQTEVKKRQAEKAQKSVDDL